MSSSTGPSRSIGPSREGHGVGIVNHPPRFEELGGSGSREVFATPLGTITRWDNRKHPHSRGYVGTLYPNFFEVGMSVSTNLIVNTDVSN